MKTAFTTITHFDDIHTLKQLDERGFSIGTSSGSLKKVFGSMDNVFGSQNFSNPVIRSLQRKYKLINSTKPALDLVAYDKNICCIERLTDAKVILSVSGFDYFIKSILNESIGMTNISILTKISN